MREFDKWAERIYSETDFGRSVATSVAGAVGLGIYFYKADWVIAAFSSVIVFPFIRLISASYHEKLKRAAAQHQREQESEGLYRDLSDEEREVVQAFVAAGGSVMTWAQTNQLDIRRAAMESLIQRDLMHTSMTVDGMRETFVLDTHLFDAGLRATRAQPSRLVT